MWGSSEDKKNTGGGWGIGNWFGKRAPKESDDEKALRVINEMQLTVNTLGKKYAKNVTLIAAYKKAAVRAATPKNKGGQGNQAEGRRLLLEVKRLEKDNIATSAQKSGLEKQLSAVKQSKTNDMIFDGYKAGNEVMVASAAKVSVEEVGDVLDETKEHVIEQEEITRALGGAEFTDLADEDELDDELAQMALGTQEDVYIPAPVHSDNAAAMRQRAEEMMMEAQALEISQAMPSAPNAADGRGQGRGGGQQERIASEQAALDNELEEMAKGMTTNM